MYQKVIPLLIFKVLIFSYGKELTWVRFRNYAILIWYCFVCLIFARFVCCYQH